MLCAICCCLVVLNVSTPPVHTELDGASIKNMKMLQRLRVLENKGQEFSSKSLRELKGSGACV